MLATDHDLLTAFARKRDENAFLQRVQRPLPVVTDRHFEDTKQVSARARVLSGENRPDFC